MLRTSCHPGNALLENKDESAAEALIRGMQFEAQLSTPPPTAAPQHQPHLPSSLSSRAGPDQQRGPGQRLPGLRLPRVSSTLQRPWQRDTCPPRPSVQPPQLPWGTPASSLLHPFPPTASQGLQAHGPQLPQGAREWRNGPARPGPTHGKRLPPGLCLAEEAPPGPAGLCGRGGPGSALQKLEYASSCHSQHCAAGVATAPLVAEGITTPGLLCWAEGPYSGTQSQQRAWGRGAIGCQAQGAPALEHSPPPQGEPVSSRPWPGGGGGGASLPTNRPPAQCCHFSWPPQAHSAPRNESPPPRRDEASAEHPTRQPQNCQGPFLWGPTSGHGKPSRQPLRGSVTSSGWEGAAGRAGAGPPWQAQREGAECLPGWYNIWGQGRPGWGKRGLQLRQPCQAFWSHSATAHESKESPTRVHLPAVLPLLQPTSTAGPSS